MVFEHAREHPSQWAAMRSIAEKLGCTTEALRRWVRQADRDRGGRPGLTTGERQRLKQLERENVDLQRANEIVKKAALFSRRRSTTERGSGALHRSTPEHLRSRAELRGPAPSLRPHISCARRSRRIRRSARTARSETATSARRSAGLDEHVCGPRKVWRQLRREGIAPPAAAGLATSSV